MKKRILLIIALLLGIIGGVISVQAQEVTANEWKTVETVDEFGDPTGEFAKIIYYDGTFSNSATSNSNLTIKAVNYNDADEIYIDVYEYARTPAKSFKPFYGPIQVKDASGLVKKYKIFAFSGGIVIEDKSLVQAMLNGEYLKFLIKENQIQSMGSAVYIFETGK